MNSPTPPLDIDKIAKYLHIPERCHEWFEYSHSYMFTTTHLAEKLKQLENDDASNGSEISIFLLPLLFNLRHAVELFLKFLSAVTGEQPEQTHNISKLFTYVKTAYNEIDKDDLEFASQTFSLSPEMIQKAIEITIKEIETIVNKYRYFLFLTDGKTKIDDEKNELFRYPTSTTSGYKIDTGQLHEKIEADEILRDIKSIMDFQFLILFLFGRRENGKSPLDACDEVDEVSPPCDK